MKCYVWMTDTFMGGWGRAAGRTSKYVVECDNAAQAHAITKAAQARSEMRSVNSGNKVPYYTPCKYQVTRRNVRGLSGPWLEFMPSEELAALKS